MTHTSEGQLSEVHVSNLSRADWARLVWGFFWRNMCCALVAGAAGGLITALVVLIIGVIFFLVGLPLQVLHSYRLGPALLGGLLGGLIGLYVNIRWLLRARFGWFRLALVSSSSGDSPTAPGGPLES